MLPFHIFILLYDLFANIHDIIVEQRLTYKSTKVIISLT